MIRNIKALGLAVVAVAAMSMMAASAAQAANGQVHIDTGPTAVITGEQTQGAGNINIFQITHLNNGAKTECAIATFEGTVSGGQVGPPAQTTSDDVTITPTYTECQAFGVAAQILMNGCKYTLTGNQAQAGTAQVDIRDCTAGKQIEVKTAGCTIKIGEQNNLSHIVFTNNSPATTAETDTHGNITVTGIAYVLSGIACPHATGTVTTDAQLTGKATFKGFVDAGTTQVTLHGHQYTRHNCGTQVGLFVT